MENEEWEDGGRGEGEERGWRGGGGAEGGGRKRRGGGKGKKREEGTGGCPQQFTSPPHFLFPGQLV